MGAVSVLWLMFAGACLTLSAMHLVAWARIRPAHEHLLLALISAAIAAITLCELWAIRAQTPAEFAMALRWLHVPGWVFFVASVFFLLRYLPAQRAWLAWTACAVRTVSLGLNFMTGDNLNYLEVSELRHIVFLGESVAVPRGILNPWQPVGQLSLLLLIAFAADATIAVWRRGDRQRALAAGGSFLIIGVGTFLNSVNLVNLRLVEWPTAIAIYAAPFLVAMSYQMSRESVRAMALATQLDETEEKLRVSEQRMRLAADAADLAIWEWNVERDEFWMAPEGRERLGFVDLDRVAALLRLDGHEAIQRIRDQGGQFEWEHRVALPDGTQRWALTRGRLVESANGKGAVMRGVSLDITQRYEAEKLFERLMDSAPVGLLIADSDGRIIQANARVSTDFGYPCEELVGQPVTMLMEERFRAGHAVDFARFVAHSSERPMAGRDVIGRRKDGSQITLSIGLTPIRTSRGQQVLASILDVTEIRKREALLKQEQAFLRQVIDISPNLIFVKDRQGRFTLVNKSLADMFGTTADALLGKTDADINPRAEEVGHFQRVDQEVMETLEKRVIPEERLTDRTGKVHWLQTVKLPLLSQDGTAQHVLGTATDITERKQIETALKESQERFRQVGRIAGEFVWETDQSGLYTYVSPAVERILGYTPREVVGRMHRHDLIPAGAGSQRDAASGTPADLPTVSALRRSTRSKNGHIVHLETSVAPVLDAAGNLTGYRGADMDVTARVESEQEIARQRDELAHLSRVSMLSELSGSLAHELNQPLAAILSNAQAALRFLAQENPNLDEAREILRDIVRDDKRAGEIITGLRALLRKGDVNYVALDMNELVQQVLLLVRSEMLNAGVTLKSAFAPGLPPVKGVPVQLQQVILNLVMNAIDAMARVEPADRNLTVSTEIVDQDFILVSVTDRGEGIPAQDLEHIFEPFVTTKAHGLGLGLSVCRRIIGAHGGRIWAVNNAGRGASFRIALPAHAGDPA